MREFTPTESAILRLAGGDLPDSATPYADIAAETGTDEATVLELLRELKEEGAIRRFGATLRHQKAGYSSNVMVAWNVPEDIVLGVGEKMAENSAVSHCYWRKPQKDWNYSMFTMVHGRTKEECLEAVRAMSEESGITDYALLYSLRELKKTSMKYF